MKIIPLFLLVSILITPLCNAEPCTQGLIRAMKEEGLSDQQIELICKKAELYNQLGSEQTIDPYTKALKQFDQGNFDDVITELGSYCDEHPEDLKAKELLAKAYLGKCEVMKASGDKAYEELVYTPYYMALAMAEQHENDPDVIYVLAKSFYINGCEGRAVKYIEKAIILKGDTAPYEYYELMGDALFTQFKQRVRLNPNHKDLYRKDIEDAKQAYNKAINLVNKDSLKAEIKNKLDSVEKFKL